jgi:ATP-binding protein involved in chromosome partitioning
MFKKVNVPILGVVQNMSLYTCPGCGNESHVFGSTDRLRSLCKENGVDYLADIPLHPSISEDANQGKPTVVAEPNSDRTSIFTAIAEAVGRKVNLSRDTA